MDGIVDGGWPRIVLHELARCPDFQPDPGWVAARIPGLDADRARAELERLGSAGAPASQDHATGVEVDDEAVAREVAQLHHDLIARAQSALHEPAERRHFGANCLAVRAEDLPALKLALHRMLVETVEPFRDRADPDRVVALGVFVVPMTRDDDGPPS
jgi:hypothetical protein